VRYIEIIAEVPAADAERTADILRTATESGAWVEMPFSQQDVESDAEVERSGTWRVHAFLPADADRGDALLQARQLVDEAGIRADIQARVIADEDWAEAWKEHFHVERYGERIVVVPTWREYEPREGEAVLTLDPGMAFGTGQHETTRMCLEALERVVRPGSRVLDVGCGSGILAIAAGKLGAGDVVAVDVDPVCIEVTSSNAAANGVPVRAAQGSLGESWPFPEAACGFDVVVANIVAAPLIAMAANFGKALATEGRLVVSGVIASREAEVVTAFEGAGLRVGDVRGLGEWRCIEAAPR
jgi:ribosomal protein L11 methyltransferase